MALANHRVQHFPDIAALSKFVQTDADIASVVSVMADGNTGGYVLVYTV